MTITEMQERKKELGYTYKQIAELSGVPVGTVQKVLGGNTESPRYDTLMALEKVLKKNGPFMVCEPGFEYLTKRQGEYTVEDYYQMPDDQRVELIDGWIYDMSAPTSIHQILTGNIFAALLTFVMTEGGECLPLVSPVDVQLNCDNRTMVQPDVVVVCDRDKVVRRCVYGAPDMIIEILSPSTRKKDMLTKLHKYEAAGVREYWLVDPDKLKVIVYDFTKEDYTIYGFDSVIPVAIWDGRCQIDFSKLYDQIRFIYEREE